jgi:hypothetical protein
LAHKLAEYAEMDAPDRIAHSESPAISPSNSNWSRRVAWVVGVLVAVLITALAFGAYRQPELLLNLMGLRYCG